MAVTVPDLGYKATLGECIQRAARLFGDRDFIVLPDERATFSEVEARSRTVARRMLAEGIGKGTRVGLFFTYGVDWVVAWLAASRIGALVMPFSTLYAPVELRSVLRLGDVAVLIAPPTLLGKDVVGMLEVAAPGLVDRSDPDLVLDELPYLRHIWLTEPVARPWAGLIDLGPTARPPTEVGDDLLERVEEQVVPADLATVVYTSGSSAEPKGVVHSHGSLVRTTAPFGQFARGNPVVFCGFPFFWIGGFLALGGALQGGLTLCCLERFEPGAALDLIEQEGCGLIAAWPSLIQSMRNHPTFSSRNLERTPRLASGPADVSVVDSPVPGIPFHRGMSETVGNWNGVEPRIADHETGAVLGEREEGELLIRGHGVTQGYYKKEREEVFDPDGWLHTGDRCLLVGGRVYFVGRFYEMVKSRGANVSPREVELALEALPEVSHAFVFGLRHPEMGEEVAAVVVLTPGVTLDGPGLTQLLRRDLSAYKVPTRWEFVDSEDAIPWLASGKPDKRALQAKAANGGGES